TSASSGASSAIISSGLHGSMSVISEILHCKLRGVECAIDRWVPVVVIADAFAILRSIRWVVDRSPALGCGELDKSAGWPFSVGEAGEISQHALMGRLRVGEALALPVGEEVRPMPRLHTLRARPGHARGFVIHGGMGG